VSKETFQCQLFSPKSFLQCGFYMVNIYHVNILGHWAFENVWQARLRLLLFLFIFYLFFTFLWQTRLRLLPLPNLLMISGVHVFFFLLHSHGLRFGGCLCVCVSVFVSVFVCVLVCTCMRACNHSYMYRYILTHPPAPPHTHPAPPLSPRRTRRSVAQKI
jgi:hypothetical protein